MKTEGDTHKISELDKDNLDSVLEISRIFDRASDFIFVVDREYHIVATNKTFLEIIDRTHDQVIGKKCYNIVYGTSEPPATCPHRHAITGQGSITQQVFGSEHGIYVLLSVMPIFAESNRLLASIHTGRVVYNEQKDQYTANNHTQDNSDAIPFALTPRQKTVLELLSEGRSSKEIAYKLNISPRTVEFHKRQLMDKLRVRNLAGLIKFAFIKNLTQ
jgi:PAS domain S-box-containing protein